MRYLALALLAGVASTALSAQDLTPKPASPATISAQRAQAATLPAEDGRDAEFAARGFLGTRADPIIRAKDGRTVWNLDAYAWMDGKAPDTVNPSLWRHQSILRKHGLFALSDGMWQVRGFDVSNMTVIKGAKGWILVDPLTNRETASAAMALVNEKLGTRTVSAVIYTHSHGDHYGGIRGVVSQDDVNAGKVAIIAPEHFIEETASENVIAGPAMGRRANYQFGGSLTPGPTGQMGSGIGNAIPAGEITLIAPTLTIRKTGEKHVVDGVTLEFQMVPETEAPAEMNVMIPAAKTLLIGELKPGSSTQSVDTVSAIPTELLLDSVATRLDPAVIGAKTLALNFVFSDRAENAKISVGNAVMISEMGAAHATPGATVTAPRQLFLALLFLKIPLAQLEAAGLRIEGDRAAVEALQAALDPMPGPFNIVEP